MPLLPLKPCRHPGCNILTRDRSGCCPKHAEQAEKRKLEARAQYEERRESAAKRGYGRAWQNARIGFLKRNQLCAQCWKEGRVAKATVVDHITPHRGDMKLFWDRENWQPLCELCHNAKTRRGK